MKTISETNQFDALVQEQGEVLQMITQGKPLPQVLHKIIQWAESQSEEGLLASVLLFDPEGQCLLHGAAPSLPADYNAAIHGVAIGPQAGSCGTAAYTRQMVIVEDIATDPLWRNWREVALEHGLRSCWSTPLINSDDVLRGTFAMYYRMPKKPSPQDLRLITLISQTALLAIEFRIAEQERQRTADRERKLYRELAERERNFRNLVMQAPVGMCLVQGPDCRVDLVNDRFLEMVGRSKEQFEKKPYWELLPEAAPDYAPILQRVFETGIRSEGREAEVVLQRNGRQESIYVNYVYEPLLEVDGTVQRVLILGIEVTEQKKFAELLSRQVKERTLELENKNRELERSNKNLEEFAYAASHDMKEPIRKIHFFADRLKHQLQDQLSEEQNRLFSRMEGAAQRMSGLIDDLLTYSHVSKGVAHLEHIDLNGIVQNVLEDLELQIHEKHAIVTTGHLPSINGHRGQLQQLFLNLVGNALKFSKPGLPPQVHISSRKITGHAMPQFLKGEQTDKAFHLIEVQDNGIGFERADAERIFNVFTRLHGNAEYRGTGVGLSIARKVAENHKGYIWAESAPGEGASFKILLPAE